MATTEHPCERCDDPTLNDRYCRECGIEWCFAMGLCRECRRGIMNPDLFGPIPEQHAPGCGLKDDPDYTMPTEALRWELWDAVQAGTAV